MSSFRQDMEFREGQPLLRSLRPVFRPHVEVSRRRFRDRVWYVAEDPVTLQYFRFGPAEYRVVQLLDGEHTLEDIHRQLLQEMGPGAPTFQDIVGCVHMLRSANLLQASVTEELDSLYERVKKKRRQRITSKASNFLFLTIPLVDPDRFLERTVRYVRFFYTRWFLALWAALVGVGIFLFFAHIGELARSVEGILSPGNLPLLWVSFIGLKTFHELSHAYMAKHLGCEVHRMGILFLVFTPTGYVDLTSLWSIEDSKKRVLVGCAGMMAELLVASLALFVFLSTSPGALRSLAYNVVFIASVSAVLFNGNPLLRFDAYYILSDLTELPNLWQNSRNYLLYLGRRYLLGTEEESPTEDPSEKAWLAGYGVASVIYRTMITVGIVLFVSSKLLGLGIVLGAAAAFVWFILPTGKLLHYLFFARKTRRNRLRCIGAAVGVLALLVVFLGIVPFPRYVRAPCVLTSQELTAVRARWGGFVESLHVEDGEWVEEGQLLAECRNEELPYQVVRTEKARQMARVRLAGYEESGNVAGAQAEAFRIARLTETLQTLRARVAALKLRAPFEGQLMAPGIRNAEGRFLRTGDSIGEVARAPFTRVVALTDQAAIADVAQRGDEAVPVRFRNEPGRRFLCRIRDVLPQASYEVPHPAITDAGGGPVILDPTAPEGERTLRAWFHVEMELPADAPIAPIGTTGVARFRTGEAPLLKQWYRRGLRLLRTRFLI